MAKDYTEFAEQIVKNVGGKENVTSVSNCMTRLRFILKDESIPKDDDLKGISGVSGVIRSGGQYQVIIGTHITNVLPFVKAALGETMPSSEGKTDASVDDLESIGKEKAASMKIVKKDSLWNRFFKIIQGCLMPLIGSMCGVGILKGILTILVTIGVLSTTDGTYIVLYNAADAFMIFLPIFVAFSASKVFDASPTVMMAVCAALVCPTLLTYVGGETALTFLKIPVNMIDYQNTFFPAITACWFASKIEKMCKKWLPEMLQLMFTPMITIMVAVPVTFLVIGPVITAISNWVAIGISSVVGFSPILAGILVGAFWQSIVLTGLHGAMIPIIINNVITLGEDPINAILTMTVFAVTGVAFGYALKVKNKERKSMAFGNVVAGLCGVTEPIIYTIALPKFKNFICTFIGGGIAGGLLGIFDVKFYTFAGSGVFALPGMIPPSGVDYNLYVSCVGALLAFAISAILAFIVNKKED